MCYFDIQPISYSWKVKSGGASFSGYTHEFAAIYGGGSFEIIYEAFYSESAPVPYHYVREVFRGKFVSGGNNGSGEMKPEP